MAKPPKKPKLEEIETKPDAWGRFERAVDVLVHTLPKPRIKSKPKGTPKRDEPKQT